MEGKGVEVGQSSIALFHVMKGLFNMQSFINIAKTNWAAY